MRPAEVDQCDAAEPGKDKREEFQHQFTPEIRKQQKIQPDQEQQLIRKPVPARRFAWPGRAGQPHACQAEATTVSSKLIPQKPPPHPGEGSSAMVLGSMRKQKAQDPHGSHDDRAR